MWAGPPLPLRNAAAGLLAFLVIVVCQPLFMLSASAQQGPQLRRGASIHQAFNWPTVTADKKSYVWPPFEEPRHQVSDERLRNAAKAGFDFIRLTVDPGPFMEFEGDRRAELDADLMAFVRRLRSFGLDVMINFHPIELHPSYFPANFVQDPDTPFMRRYFELVARISAQLATIDPGRVAIEPLNEPQTGYEPTTERRWQAIAERSHAAVRSVAPNLLVLVTGAMAGGIDGLLALKPKPFQGSNVHFSLHFYEPYEFTHQSLQPGAGKFMFRVPFPGAAADQAPYLVGVEKRIRESGLAPDVQTNLLFDARKKVRAYFESKASIDLIDQRLGEVSAWASANGVAPEQIVVGEFGVMRTDFNGAVQGDRVNYIKAVRESAERRKFGWALWLLDWGEMGLALVRGGSDLDDDILLALGLKSD